MAKEKFCFVHIDVDVYQSAKETFEFAWPRMPAGAIAVFDDYGFMSCDGIPKLLAEYRGGAGKLVIHNLNGHAMVVKTSAS
jgi:O-methyltransferase